MAVTSKTDVCNLALAKLGARRINSYQSDSSVEAQACQLQFDHVVDGLLRRHQWNFATSRSTLTRLTNDPPSEWTAAWQLPNDFIRLIRIVGIDPSNPVRDFTLEGRHLLTLGGDIQKIVYITNETPVPYWDPLFIDAVVYKLAAEICGDVTKNPERATDCLQKLESLALPAAQTADAREVLSGENFGPRQLASQSALVNARFRSDGRPPFIPVR